MKQYLKIAVVLLFTSLALVSCKDKNPADSNDNYYVRYILSAYPSIVSKVTYADVNQMVTETLSVRNSGWTVTIGPVKKGFRAYVKTEEYTATAKIEVCKNSDPFALKASGVDSASYTIDY